MAVSSKKKEISKTDEMQRRELKEIKAGKESNWRKSGI
jgi:hypothetical protein